MYHLYMDFTVAGLLPLNDLSVIQMYAQFPDPDRPGMFQSFTCSARYATYLSSSYVYNVFNYYGPMSFKAGERTFNNNENDAEAGKYAEINWEDHDFSGPWIADTRDPVRAYASDYKEVGPYPWYS